MPQPTELDALYAFLVAAAVTALLTPVTMRIARAVGAIDEPRERGLSERPTPLLGGLAIFAGTLVAGLIWLPVRLFLGFEWAVAGWDKLTGTGWTDGGASLLGYWKSAVAIPTTGHAAITFEWYRSFLQFLIDHDAQSWFAWLVVLGELAVGIGLLLGILTGIAAFFGATMNMSYLLAGSTSVNPIMFAFTIGLILAWKVAGYYGVDRYLLPRLGVPWGARPTAGGGVPRAATGG